MTAADRVAEPAAADADAARLGGRLEDHHAPETNGWMAVCRRCGSATDGPAGRHAPNTRQIDRLTDWIERQWHAGDHSAARRRADT